jgi:hypothetical protein
MRGTELGESIKLVPELSSIFIFPLSPISAKKASKSLEKGSKRPQKVTKRLEKASFQ